MRLHLAGPGRWPSRRLGLRQTVTLAFAAGALVLSALLSVGTYLAVRNYLVAERERAALGQGFANAAYVRDGLRSPGQDVSDVLGTVSASPDTTVFLRRGTSWYSSSLTASSDQVPAGLQEAVAAGGAALAWVRVDGSPALVVGTAVPAVDAEFYELARTSELTRTLTTLAVALAGFALLTTVAGATLGRWSTRRLLAPLDVVAAATARIAGGDLGTRLPSTDDPELVTIVGSFNAMVDTLAERVRRDARFTADVSHELRSPLTTLTTAVQVMQGRRAGMSASAQQALDLLGDELARFRTVVEDLLELGRLDATVDGPQLTPVRVGDLVREALTSNGRDTMVVEDVPGAADLVVCVDKQQMARLLVNLFVNADVHGGGLDRVALAVAGRPDEVVEAEIRVEDAGPGVATADRERIFERFVRGGSRGSLAGSGLGLSIVAETVRAHGGSVRYVDRPGGGARFAIGVPLATAGAVP